MFEYLEVDDNEHKQHVHYQEIKKEIPDNQRLSYSDLCIIQPLAYDFKGISSRILKKYSVLPLFIQMPDKKALLPKHLNSEFWGTISGDKEASLYVAMLDPFNIQVLNILRSVTKYSVVSVPLTEEALKQYMLKLSAENDEERKYRQKNAIIKESFSFLYHNFYYIITFLLIIGVILSAKLYINT